MSFNYLKKLKEDKHTIWLQSIFYLLSFLCMLFLINPELIYLRDTYLLKSYNFRFSLNHFIYMFSFPGGPLRYITLLIQQLFYYPVIGSLVLILIAFLLYYFTIHIFKKICGIKPGDLKSVI